MNRIQKWLLFVLLFSAAGKSSLAQGSSITGPTCDLTGTSYYSYSLYAASSYTYNITSGVDQNGNPSGTNPAGYSTLYVKWNTGATSGSILIPGASLNVTIYSALSGGSITSTLYPTITFNTVPSTITCSLATGGTCTPSFHYQWQSGTDGVNYSNISGATAQNLSFSSGLLMTTYYRRMVTESVSNTTAYSNYSSVTISNPLVTGSVSPSSQQINYNSNAATLSVTGVSGASTPYSYLWQSSADNSTWSNISTATGTSYTPTALTATTYFRVGVTSNGGTLYTNSVIVEVYPQNPIVPGSVTPAAQTINFNTIPSQLSSSGASGGNGPGSFTYQWQSSPDNSTWVNVVGTASTYTPTATTATTYFRVAITSSYKTGYSSSAVVKVTPQLLPGTVAPAYIPIASGSSPGGLSGTTASGGNCGGAYSYQWLISSNDTTFTMISGATAPSYTPGTLTSNTWYSRQVVNCNGVTVNSDTIQVLVNPPTPDMPFSRVRSYLKPGLLDTNAAKALTSPFDVSQSTQYFDGLGRPVQTVAMQQSPLQKDEVSLHVYDQFGRETFQYMPYAASTTDGNYKNTAQSDQYGFNAAQFPGEQNFYGMSAYEQSPLERVNISYSPGANWVAAERGVTTQYLVNTVADSVVLWNIAFTQGSIPTMSSYYPAGTLYKTKTIDENGQIVIKYTDFDGKIILQKVQSLATPGTAHYGWLCTYYIYDNLNLLRFIIQPQEVFLMSQSSSWVVSPSIANTYCFRYEYDYRDRMIIKKVPSAGEVHMVYDLRDRLVMSQDSNMRANKQWLVTTYDTQNRVDSVGLLTDPNYYNNLPHYTASAQASLSFLFIGGYPAYTVENYHHYDDYSWVTVLHTTPTATMDTSYNGNTSYFITSYNTGPTYAVPLTPYMITRGVETGRTDYLLGTNQAQYTVNFFDDRARMIEKQSSNYFRGLDKDITQYDFSGKPLRHLLISVKNMNNYQVHYVSDQYTYDAALRPTGLKDKIDGTLITVDTLQYNELAQLQKKTLGGGLDSLVYTYNVRGWMTGINKNYVAGTTSDYFGLELAYDKQSSVSTTTYAAAQYNGNITGLIWKSAGDQTNRKYDYTYDNANRLTAANFLQNPSGSTWNKTAMDYSVGYLGYDANGNIYGMDQWGFKLGAPTGLIDELSYHYQTNSNQLSQVIDAVNDSASTLGDFHYKTKGGYDYLYDGNGNLKIDNNKGIDSIGYNYLNLTQYVHIKGKGTVQYAYNTDGTKWAKIVTDSTQSPVKVTTTSYLKAYQYINDTLEQFNFSEGRQRYQKLYQENGDSLYGFEYDYFLKDHLSDTRVILTTEEDTTHYIATMEPATRGTENALFYNVDSTSYATTNVPGGYPGGTNGGANDSVAMVSGSPGDHTQGPALLLKVMSGDSISFGVNSYYVGGGSAGSTSSSLSSLVGALANGLLSLGAGGGEGGTFSVLDNTSSGPVAGALNSFFTANDPTPPSTPKAYLNWMLLDNQFNYVSGNNQSGAMGVGSPNVLNTLASTIKLKHSGYLYIWVSNETQNWMVFFDNLSIQHFSGPMLEETHYYPFGLTMAGISDKALKQHYAENKYKFQKQELQNKEFSDGSGLELYEFTYRFHDPQIGRFLQVDPLCDSFPQNSNYSFSGDQVTSHIELEGLEPVPIESGISTVAGDYLGHKLGHYLGQAIGAAFAPFNMLGSMHAAGNAHNPAVKAQLENEAKGYMVESLISAGTGVGLVKLGSAVMAGFSLGANPFAEGMSSVAKGSLGEDLTKGVLQSQYKDANILEQVNIKLDGASLRADFVVIQDGKVVSVVESKVDGSELSNGQKLFFNDKDIGTLTGKNAGDFKGVQVDPSQLETKVYRWDSKTGTFVTH